MSSDSRQMHARGAPALSGPYDGTRLLVRCDLKLQVYLRVAALATGYQNRSQLAASSSNNTIAKLKPVSSAIR